MSSSSNDEPSYTILQINRDATKQEIRKAYQRLAMLRRPDKNMGDFANACAAFNKVYTYYFSPLYFPPPPPPRIYKNFVGIQKLKYRNPAQDSILCTLRPN